MATHDIPSPTNTVEVAVATALAVEHLGRATALLAETPMTAAAPQYQVHRMAAVAARTARDIRDDVQERMLSVPEQAATALNCSAQFLNCSVQLQLEH